MATIEEIKRLVKVMVASFGPSSGYINPEILALMPTAYAMQLEEFELEELEKGLRNLLVTSTKIPSAMEFRAEIIRMRFGDIRAGGDAWGDVKPQVRGTRKPEFKDPLVARVMQALGWDAYRNSDENDPSWRARFIELYDRYAKLEKEAMLRRPLAPGDPAVQLKPSPADYSSLEEYAHALEAFGNAPTQFIDVKCVEDALSAPASRSEDLIGFFKDLGSDLGDEK